MDVKKVNARGVIVKKSNLICRSRWSIESIYEPRIVAIVAARVRQKDPEFFDYEIPVAAIVGSGANGQAYSRLKRAVFRLIGRVITVPTERGWSSCAIFSYCEYDGKKGVLKIRFDPVMKSHYLELRDNFTMYNLSEFLLLPGTYSQRLYEILKSWENRPEVTITLTDLHEMLAVPPSMRKTFRELRRRVLEKAHRDISALTRLEYEWEAVTKSGQPLKRGRKVVAVRFVMGKKTVAKTRAEKKKVANKKTATTHNKLVLSVVNCHHQPVSDGQCVHADGSDGCRYCLAIHASPRKQK